MRALIPLVFLVAALWGSYVVGVRSGRLRGSLSRDDRRELERLRHQERWLLAKAAEHSALGDDFAVIVAAKINDEKEIG